MVVTTVPVGTVNVSADSSGEGWSFDSATGTLTITSIAGAINWRNDSVENEDVKTVVIQDGETYVR